MKEKLILIVILASAAGLLFHHQTQESNTLLTSNVNDLTLPTEIPLPNMELIQVDQNLSVEESADITQCEDSVTTTDDLSFKDAFAHFRNCLGSNQEFSWKGKEYLTLLAEEVENIDIHEAADSTTVEKINNNNLEVVSR